MFHKILSNDGLVTFHYRSYGAFFLQQNRLHNSYGGFTHYRNYRAVFLEASTTNELLIPHLSNRQVTVVTNCIHHAVKLVDLGISTRIIGGKVKHSTDASIGSTALEQIRQLNFDCAFIGANEVDANYFTTPDMEEAVIKRTVIANAQKAYVLADASKLGQVTYAKVAEVEKVTIITNASEEGLLK